MLALNEIRLRVSICFFRFYEKTTSVATSHMLAVNVIKSAFAVFSKEKIFHFSLKCCVRTYPKASDFSFLGTYIPFSLGMKKFISSEAEKKITARLSFAMAVRRCVIISEIHKLIQVHKHNASVGFCFIYYSVSKSRF